jgi:hypothetical protein
MMKNKTLNNSTKLALDKIRFVFLGATLALTGCSHVYNQNPEAVSEPALSLEQSPSCCDSFSQLQYKQLPKNFRATLTIDVEDAVLDLGSGKTYVEALELPQSDSTILLEIESRVSHRNFSKPSTVFFPTVTLLDESYAPIATLDNLPFTYGSTLGTWRHIHMVITLDKDYKNTRYALIHTTDERISQAVSTRYPKQIVKRSNFDTMIYHQSTESKKRIHFSRQGVINVLAYSE